MRRHGHDDVAAVARRRLELLREELEAAAPPAAPTPPDQAPDPPAPIPESPDTGDAAAPVAPAGRHARTVDAPARRWAGWLEDRLPSTLRGRVALGGRELAVLVALVGTGLALAGVVVLRSGSGGDPLPVRPPRQAGAGALVTPAASATPAPTSAGATTDPERVVVDVAGKVRHPGVVRLPVGSRVIDALRKAGGARPRVDLTSLNLAQVLTDGQQILVGVKAAPGIAAAAAPGSGPMVDLNSATLTQLESLPGVGPVTAQKILTWRTSNGAFSSVDELLEIDGIGEKTLADLAPYVTL